MIRRFETNVYGGNEVLGPLDHNLPGVPGVRTRSCASSALSILNQLRESDRTLLGEVDGGHPGSALYSTRKN